MFLSNGAIVPTQVDTIGDRTPMFADASYYGSGSMQLSGLWAAYGALYKSQLWVGTVVRKLAMATARMPFDIKRSGAGNEQSPEDGPLTALMRRPNPRMSGFMLWQWTSSTRDVYGEAFWLKLRDNKGVVRELHPMHPTNVVVRRTADGSLEYIYSAGVRDVSMLPPIPEQDVVAFIGYNPDTLNRGLSNLESLRMTLLNEDASRRATASFWDKGARPSVMLGTDGNLSQGAIDRLKKQFAASHGGADNMGGTVVFEEGIKPTIVQLNMEEMQYIESRKLNREEVCAAYDVPPPVVHILDHATFSNITEQLRSQYRDTMAPRFVDFESVIDHQLVTDFYAPGEVFTRFNMDEVLRGDFEVRAESANKLVQVGVLKPAEARPMFGLAPAGPEADQLYGNAALVPLGSNGTPAQVATDGTLIPAPLAAPASVPTAVPSKTLTVRQLMGRISRVKASKQATRDKLAAEHSRELKVFFAAQRKAVKSAVGQKDSGIFDPSEWDGDLADILHTLSTATAKAIGTKVATDLGGQYNAEDIADWLKTDSVDSAKNINKATADQIAAALSAQLDDEDPEDAVDGVFDGEIAARADQISLSRVAMVAGLASQVAARQNDAATKTWVVTAANPRPAHSVMDGETVALNEVFSNGMNGPGDFSGGADEVAGCTCDLQFSKEG
ncbi:phage portal protein [Arthrobacter sp. PsM3]|uniref:phage portal protein n=1 Tax=Arthrobacter sp. PsM3 TaxID=3030531 RepID=UPI00263B101B|nr:phage portal protein [Arthrobacter sp. PsM3]MDN4645368.1 phage portal protein [Arthrobacter sp. PsM3]